MMLKHKFILVSLFNFLLNPNCAEAQIEFSETTPMGKALESIGLAKVYGDNALTKEQLKECLSMFDSSADQRDSLKADIDLKANLLKKAGVIEGKINSTTVNEYSRSSVDAYNALVDKYEALWVQIDNHERSVNGKIAQYNSQVSKINKQCARKNYYQEDYKLILQELNTSSSH